MKEQQFIDNHLAVWDAFEAYMVASGFTSNSGVSAKAASNLTSKDKKERKAQLEKAKAQDLDINAETLMAQYRAICHHLAIAKQREYSPFIVDRLNKLAVLGHRCFYATRMDSSQRLRWFFALGFPHRVRASWRYVAVAAALFVIPLITMGYLCFVNPDATYSMMSAQQADSYVEMYQSDNETFGRERQADTDLAMFGFYIRNNIGIGFRTFASGIVFGIGSVFFLVYNGLAIGSTAGYLTQAGVAESFYAFVSSHGPFELSAIVLCGAAGLRLGYAVVVPGRYGRLDAIKLASQEAIEIVIGAAIMLFFAAIIEAFWSSSSFIPPLVKYLTGAFLWILTFTYFTVMGRR